MKYSVILFIVLFVVIWIMHKPFNIHNTKLKKFHEWLEISLIVQGIIIINQLYFIILIIFC